MSDHVSIIVPCYNERPTIHFLLDALFTQTFPRPLMEVVIADGGSTDGTPEAIAEWADQHKDLAIIVVQNQKQTIPAALNTAIRASSAEIIIRMDAHSKPQPDYVQKAVTALQEGHAQNVGGVWDIQPGSESWMAHSIAAAAGHPIGVGDARYRYSEKPGFVDTVPFGAFHRALLDRIGLFDETLLTNEDYEFNTRIRQDGGKIWFDPQIRSAYYARSTLTALAKQYWRYGYWKWQMLRRYPKTIRWRQALPPLFVVSLIGLAVLTPFWQLAIWLLLGMIGIYIIVLVLAGIQIAIKNKNAAMIIGVPLAIACMHFAWGTGFLWSIIYPPKAN
jgi:cellulose synthase/poly-beta-1,6-N-acetylglucosamine synthase-like glycosyltransferase